MFCWITFRWVYYSCTSVPKRNHFVIASHKLGWAGVAKNVDFCFLFLSTVILVMGGWLNSFLLFKISLFFLPDILTASSACLVRGSRNLLVISILNVISSSLWSFCLCLNSALSSLPLRNWLKCSAPLTRAAVLSLIYVWKLKRKFWTFPVEFAVQFFIFNFLFLNMTIVIFCPKMFPMPYHR